MKSKIGKTRLKRVDEEIGTTYLKKVDNENSKEKIVGYRRLEKSCSKKSGERNGCPSHENLHQN